MGKYFGTDGFRGEANVDLKVEDAFRVGRFLGWYYKNQHPGERCRIVIGKDTRRSSYMFEDALSSGITASGADVYLMHVTTTPSVAYIVRVDGFDCGIMISASHNPYYDNGIKVISGTGEKIDDETIDRIEEYLDGKTGEIPLALRDDIGRTVDYAAGRNRYIGYLISIADRSFKGKDVALDCSNGSASSIAKPVFDALGARTHVMACEPNGTNINDGVGSTHIEKLQEFVVREGCDIGFAYDGDADRCLAVDEHGEVINGDQIMYACGKLMKEEGELKDDTIVVTVMSNFGLFKAFDREGIRYEKTKVGDRFVYECMSKEGYSLGGEQSGHIIFSKLATTGDGILTSLRLMEVMLERKCEASKLWEECPMYPQCLRNIRVTDKQKVMDDRAVNEAIKKAEAELADKGRILVRGSGTEPLIRVMVEADRQEECERLVDMVIDVIKEQGLSAEG
ncbi:MAG TPA: phosphoglucosamine mutase [Candidatus Avilachnospira avicola]|nr:phosphoglucosamine mutase [Candidatus Avilachnospira avicola]